MYRTLLLLLLLLLLLTYYPYLAAVCYHQIRIISANCCIHTVVPPDDGPRYAQNM